MATIRKRGNFQWEAQVRRKGWAPVSSTFNNRTDAQAWGRQIEGEMDRGIFVSRIEAESTTLYDALQRYQREVTPSKKPSTQDSEKRKIKAWLSDPLSQRFLAGIRSQDVAAWRDAKLAEGYSPNTVRLQLAVLSHLFTICTKEWGMESLRNPLALIRKPSLSGLARQRRLEESEEQRLLDAASEYGRDMHTLIVLALETAMRRGEIVAAEWKHYDPVRHVLHLPDTKNGSGRFVPINSRTRAAISTLPRRLDGRMFRFETGNGITQAWLAICERAHISDLHFHDLRHEATSRLFEKGLDTMEVASVTGHKTLQMLLRYTHLRAEELVRKLDAA